MNSSDRLSQGGNDGAIAMVWRIFSKLWASRNTPQPQPAIAVEAEVRVASHWMTVLRRAFDGLLKQHVSTRDLATTLVALSDAQLLDLDPAIRHDRYQTDRGGLELVTLSPISSIDDEREAQWFVAACDPNGFLRAKALQAFQDRPGNLALPIALIRCDDWVDEVRAAALDLLRHLLVSDQADLFVHLPLLLILRERQRFAQDVWPTLVEPFLLGPSRAQARWEMTTAKSSRLRMLAYSLIQRADPQRLHEAFLQAVADPDPVIARWGFTTGCEGAEISLVADIVQRASVHPTASVRTQALRMRAAHGLPGVLEAMEAALFDASRGARDAAGHFLRNNTSIDPSQRWREAISAGDSARARVALDSLAPIAKPGDIALLLPWLTHSAGQVRATALRALFVAQPPDLPTRVAQALADPSVAVVRTATKFLQRNAHLCTDKLFRDAYANAANAPTRAGIVRAAMLAGKWETLDLYLTWYLQTSDNEQRHLVSAIAVWSATDKSRFTPLPASMRTRLTELVEQIPRHGTQLPLESLAHAIAYA